jgi:CDP-paratose 2-epimerase
LKYLITGGCGFLGSNLAVEVLALGHELVIIDNLARKGSQENLDWLKTMGSFVFHKEDIRDFDQISRIVNQYRPNIIFHVAGQVAMTTSMQNPRLDFETNGLGTFNILESVRINKIDCKIIFSSTNKVYGDLESLSYKEDSTRYILTDYPAGIPESLPLDFRTPYGCSKGLADQYIKDYAKTFGLKTIVFRHSSIYGGRQFSTSDQGWIGWFISKAIESKNNKNSDPFTISGNGKQVRDVLFSKDLVDCYFGALEHPEIFKGEVYNIGGGVENSLSLLELFSFLEKELSVKLNYKKLSPRESDQKVFIADISKASQDFSWSPKTSKEEGLVKMIDWVKSSGPA